MVGMSEVLFKGGGEQSCFKNTMYSSIPEVYFLEVVNDGVLKI